MSEWIIKLQTLDLNTFYWYSFWIVIGGIIFTVVFLWLFIVQGHKYSVEDTEAHSEGFGDVIREGHGKMTIFLWISFALLLMWTIFYFIVTWEQFLVVFYVS